MKKTLSILQGFTELYYHSLPGALESITLTPEREAIFKYLAQIGSDRFKEFVLDILIIVERQRPVDITDGPGDEKQDILTITPNGERHLTQCKHTLDYKDHYTGDELDLLFGACVRKNCKIGLFVTNSDLTPQGKRYVTDKEFSRGWNGPKETLPDINYWNGARIWERIATNNAILNKWFSGMSQAHGMRRFFFDLVIQRLPSAVTDQGECGEIAEKLGKKYGVIKSDDKISYEVKLNDAISFIMSDWFHSDLDLGIQYVSPKVEPWPVNIPLKALRIQVSVADDVGQYNPAQYRDFIVKTIGNEALPSLSETEWWHLVATTPQAFVFLHDIVEPKVTSISNAHCYVRVEDHSVESEKDWVFPQGGEYERLSEGSQGELLWRHIPSGTSVNLVLEQRIHPVTAYEYYLLQMQQVKRLANHEFRVIPNASQEIIDRVRHMVDLRWVVMLSENNDLFWAFPPTEDKKRVQEIEKTLRSEGLSVLYVANQDRKKLLKMIEAHPPSSKWYFNNSESDIVEPIWFNKRLFWFSKTVKIARIQRIETWVELLRFKAKFENRHAFDFMEGKEKKRIASGEIPGLLFDLMSVRGDQMIDLKFYDSELSINLRIREKSLKSASAVLPAYLIEFEKIIREILNILQECENPKVVGGQA